MRLRTVVWRGVDAPRMEVAHVELPDGALRARGTQIGAGYELRYEVDGERFRGEVVGGLSVELDLGEADHFDLEFSPLFNSFPIRRHRLHEGGGGRDFVMTWIEVPGLGTHRSEQTYEPVAEGRVRFRSDDFTATLELDDDGLVRRYPDLAEMVS